MAQVTGLIPFHSFLSPNGLQYFFGRWFTVVFGFPMNCAKRSKMFGFFPNLGLCLVAFLTKLGPLVKRLGQCSGGKNQPSANQNKHHQEKRFAYEISTIMFHNTLTFLKGTATHSRKHFRSPDNLDYPQIKIDREFLFACHTRHSVFPGRCNGCLSAAEFCGPASGGTQSQ
jgi:hypothetical protein